MTNEQTAILLGAVLEVFENARDECERIAPPECFEDRKYAIGAGTYRACATLDPISSAIVWLSDRINELRKGES